MNTQDDSNLIISIQGEIDLIKSESNQSGLFTGEGMGDMELTLKDGEKTIKIKVHRLSFEGTRIPDNE